ncbi:MAG: NAD(P)/FAD-dependent oxidoreductase [Trueperaceae bacterium]
MTKRPKVIIVGAGFGGLYAAKALRDAPAEVLMIDKNNYHTFQPLLYQVATAGLDAGDIAYQVRGIFRSQKNFNFRQATVVDVLKESNQVVLEDGELIDYDYLIAAPGAVYNDFGTPGVRDHAFVIKSLERSIALRGHILQQFERAAVDPSLVEKGALTFVVVGAGPTGVEMSGALVELFERVLQADYPELDLRLARVVLVEAASAVLPTFSQRSQRYAERVLRRRGVDVRLQSTVAEARDNAVVLRSGEVIPTNTIVWAAGVRASHLGERLETDLLRGFRVKVEPDLSLQGYPNVFAVGDLAGPGPDVEAGKLLPQVAQVAIQGGKHAAATVVRRLQGRPGQPFVYKDLGSMAIVGRNAGVAELSPRFFNLKLRGFIGWLGWLFLHLIYLPGFRNRFSAVFSWAYNYFTFDRHARLILHADAADWPMLPDSPLAHDEGAEANSDNADTGGATDTTVATAAADSTDAAPFPVPPKAAERRPLESVGRQA